MSSFGLSGPVNLLLAFILVLALIGIIAWAVRRVAKQRLGTAARARQPRLAVLDTAAVDARRQLVIIRRDNVEHLLMIGGGSDLVIESNIVRGSPASAREGGRTPSVLDAPRTAPVYEGTSWPAPQPELSARLQRTYPPEEPAQWAPSAQRPTEESAGASQPGQNSGPRAPRSIRVEPPALPAVPREAPPASAGAVAGSSPLRVSPADRTAASEPPFEAPAAADRPEPAPVSMIPPVATVASSAPTVPPRPDMLQRPGRSEAAGSQGSVRPSAPRGPEESSSPLSSTREPTDRQPAPDPGPKPTGAPRFSFPNVKFDRSTPPAPNPVRQSPARTASGNPSPPPNPAKPKTRTLYESLEQEMASLLGKPPEKS